MKTLPQITRRHLVGLACAVLCAGASLPAAAQNYPNKPVRLVVPYPPGGPTDTVARVIAQQLQDQMGQSFIVENRPGAGGNLGAEAVSRAAPDGYTMVVATTAHAINPSLFKNLGYRLLEDFAPVSMLTSGPLVLVANPKLPANNVSELIALAKSQPDGLNFASSGNGQSTHLSAELFNSMAKVKMSHVPYQGSAPALVDLMAGQTDIMFDAVLSALPHIQNGKLKALAVTSAQRSAAMPDTPTVAESGLPGYEAIAWNGLLVPANTPQPVIDRLNAELRTALASASVKERLDAQGFSAAWNTPSDYAAFLKAEVAKWAAAVQASGAQLN